MSRAPEHGEGVCRAATRRRYPGLEDLESPGRPLKRLRRFAVIGAAAGALTPGQEAKIAIAGSPTVVGAAALAGAPDGGGLG